MRSLKLITGLVAILFIANINWAQRSGNNTTEAYDNDNVQTVSGTISDINHPFAKLTDDNGKEYQIHMGPYWYWEQNQYQLQHNVRAHIKGEVKEVQGRYEFYPWEIVQDGKTMTFTDDNGVPKWSKGRNKGNGNGNGNGCCPRGRGRCRY